MSHQQHRARQTWSDADIAFLTCHYPDRKTAWIADQLCRNVRAVYDKASQLALVKSRSFMASEQSGRMRSGTHKGREFQFKKGQPAWNKGMVYDAGGRSVDTRFQKGVRQGRAAELWQPIGHERIADGYLQRKVTATGATWRDYRPVHHLVWESSNGPIPDGHAVVFKDGNRQHIVLNNLELVSRAELMRRNSRHRLPKELNQVIGLRAALVRKINHRTKTKETA